MMCSLESDRRSTQRPARAGFSLIELSVVLVIVSIVAVMGLELTANYMNRTAYKVTNERLDVIDRAIVAYRRSNNKLPCPANQGLNASSGCYGKENNGLSGSCNDIAHTCNASNFTADLVYGDVPVRDLGLPLSMMTDGYGNRFSYVVNRDQTYTSTFSAAANFKNVPDGIEVRSGKLDADCTVGGALCQKRGMASYFLFSAGADKRGARTPNGAVARACQSALPGDVALTDGQIDTVNCRFASAVTLVKNGSTPVVIPNNAFYDSRFNNGTTDAHFDDLVKWRSKSGL